MGRGKEKIKVIVILLLLITTLIMPGVSSLAIEYNTETDIKHPVRLNGGIPDSSVECRITIFYPNRSILVNYQEMTRSAQGNYYNYTLDENQTSKIGEYVYDVTCLSSSINKTSSFPLYINPGGIEPSELKTDTITRTIYFTAGIGLVFFIGFIFFRTSNPTYKYTLLILAALFFLISTNFIFISLQNDIVDPTIQDFFSFFASASFYAFWFLGFILATLWIFAVINTILIKNNERHIRKMGFEENQHG